MCLGLGRDWGDSTLSAQARALPVYPGAEDHGVQGGRCPFPLKSRDKPVSIVAG